VHVHADKYQDFKTDVQEGIGEVAGVLFRVAKYAYEKFHIHDLVVSLPVAAAAAAVNVSAAALLAGAAVSAGAATELRAPACACTALLRHTQNLCACFEALHMMEVRAHCM
jgi:hypothetical protein